MGICLAGDPLGCFPPISTTAGTLELGIFTDKFLWETLKVNYDYMVFLYSCEFVLNYNKQQSHRKNNNILQSQVRGETDKKLKQHMEAIVQKAVASAQKLMQLDSISSWGGFKLVIKNITVWKKQVHLLVIYFLVKSI